MMAAQQIVEYLRRIEQLQMEQGDVGAPVEIFRLSGLVRGMLVSEGDGIWAELEEYGVVKQVLVEQLKETWKQLTEMRIGKLTSGKGTRGQVVTEFPRYLELPGPVVRERIVSYMTNPNDELSVAKAIPSEVQFLSGPLNLIQLKAVFPLIMKRKLLESVDVMNLCAAHPYICGFIRNYYETVLWKDLDYLEAFSRDLEVLNLEHVVSALDTNPDLVVIPPVLLFGFNQATWDKLRICGNQIFHCEILLKWDWEAEQKVQLIERSLELLPNLRTLIISNGFRASVEEGALPRPTDPDFPELPYLRNLIVGDLVDCENIFGASNIMETLANFVYGVAQCPLKVLSVQCDRVKFHHLLTLMSDNWGNTLESLKIKLVVPFGTNRAGHAGTGNPDFGNLDFPKLKHIALTDVFLFSKSWEFLLCCPALKELEYYDSNDSSKKQSEYESGQGQALAELKPWIQLYNDRARMLKSNVWKLFPQLELVRFKEWELIFKWFQRFKKVDVVTRKECLAHQLQ